jgi:TetR/AcrR family transcriptional repressor of nem operon
MTPPPSGRQATKEETREALVVAGLLEFSEKGLDAPSLDAICARAGFTRGAFYVHFRDRDDLLVAVVERILNTSRDAIIGGDDAPTDLEQTLARYVSAVAANSPAIGGTGEWRFRHTLGACARLPALRARYVELQRQAVDRIAGAARAGQRAKRVRSDVSAETLAELLMLLNLGIASAIDLRMPFDLLGGGRGLAKLLAAPKTRRRTGRARDRRDALRRR